MSKSTALTNAISWSETESQRRQLVERGQTVIANLKIDKRLIAWARKAGLLARIDRRSKWGNPFKIDRGQSRDLVCEKYRDHLLNNEDLMESLGELRGKVLACWCHPERCHGCELIAILEAVPEHEHS